MRSLRELFRAPAEIKADRANMERSAILFHGILYNIMGKSAGQLRRESSQLRRKYCFVNRRLLYCEPSGKGVTALALEIRHFPGEEEMNALYDRIPHDRMEFMAYSGLFLQEFPFEERMARLVVYLPEQVRHDCCCVLILVPDGVPAQEFIERAGWISLSERDQFAVLALSSLDGWDADSALRLAQKTRDVIAERKYYCIGKSQIYVAAYGGAAATGERLILTTPGTISGLALIGTAGCSAGELKALGEAPSAVPYVPMKDVPCPLSILTPALSGENRAAVEFFTAVNRLDPEPYLRDGTLYYLPDRVRDDNWVQSENTAPIALRVENGLDEYSAETTGAVWNELKKYFRALDYVNTSTHAARTKEDWGTLRREAIIDGWLRTWEEFVPSAAGRGRKCPLVIDLHGGGGCPEHELNQSCWVRTAKARDLFLAVPHGSLRRFENGTMTHPAWNASGRSAAQDDFRFIRHIVEDMLARYPGIDRTRVYITGHSMGSAMTQQVILHMPQYFAAAASNGGVVRGGFFGGLTAAEGTERYRMPVIIQMGEFDRGGGTFERNADAKNTAAYWIARNGAGDIAAPDEYVNGPFHHKVYHNKAGVPMVHYITTENKPHVVTAQDALMYYDEFLSKYSRLEDGTICYMGRPIE